MHERTLLKILGNLEEKIAGIEGQMASQEALASPERMRELSREHKRLSEMLKLRDELADLMRQIEEDEELLHSDDAEIAELAAEEIPQLRARAEKIERRLLALLVPPDENEGRPVIVEIRAGTGGEEAALFAADLFRMYSRYAERKNWKVEVIDSNPTELGGFKEIIFTITGEDAYRLMKHESGVHRVQRIPVTESGGRIHTSAASVAVLPEVPEQEIEINPEDLKIDTFRSSGAGGQHVNKTESAVRITHIPTGIVVTCQAERSQHKNRALALRILKSKLAELMRSQSEKEIADRRRNQVGTGDRSEKIRTYNFPQNRITDHRIGYTAYNLQEVLDGDLDDLFDAIQSYIARQLIETIEV
ncbi:peptide chain release factor 1 [bacterium]|nr:peptide chain release factor 1 [bacterium]